MQNLLFTLQFVTSVSLPSTLDRVFGWGFDEALTLVTATGAACDAAQRDALCAATVERSRTERLPYERSAGSQHIVAHQHVAAIAVAELPGETTLRNVLAAAAAQWGERVTMVKCTACAQGLTVTALLVPSGIGMRGRREFDPNYREKKRTKRCDLAAYSDARTCDTACATDLVRAVVVPASQCDTAVAIYRGRDMGERRTAVTDTGRCVTMVRSTDGADGASTTAGGLTTRTTDHAGLATRRKLPTAGDVPPNIVSVHNHVAPFTTLISGWDAIGGSRPDQNARDEISESIPPGITGLDTTLPFPTGHITCAQIDAVLLLTAALQNVQAMLYRGFTNVLDGTKAGLHIAIHITGSSVLTPHASLPASANPLCSQHASTDADVGLLASFTAASAQSLAAFSWSNYPLNPIPDTAYGSAVHLRPSYRLGAAPDVGCHHPQHVAPPTCRPTRPTSIRSRRCSRS